MSRLAPGIAVLVCELARSSVLRGAHHRQQLTACPSAHMSAALKWGHGPLSTRLAAMRPLCPADGIEGNATANKNGKGGKKRTLTPHQQALNKLAQKKYRLVQCPCLFVQQWRQHCSLCQPAAAASLSVMNPLMLEGLPCGEMLGTGVLPASNGKVVCN